MNESQTQTGSALPASPVKPKIGGVFVPVRDIEASRRWYCRVLGLEESACEIMNGHLCPLPMTGAGLILDTMPQWGGREPGGAPAIETPAFMLPTDDLEGALAYMKALGVELVTGIEHDHWFVVKDPDGNKLMICRE
ncbi:VOC family protein [Paenibacillus sp. MWE-103]|uniref:VOC family protein n=1 Tax=Paenibacillus artemisiicola TaxID=1172618 RepID=A0ABS3WJP7_9BACL|nr:VOC family protein [Paenibacillus artemisiicola]MBO7748539.1 VOC family protein [Paenibacillus artemisiicola]